MKRLLKIFVILGVVPVLVVTSGCRLPVDVNLEQYPDLHLHILKLDRVTPFPGVDCQVSDTQNKTTSNSQGDATLMVYRSSDAVNVTFSFWQRTPDGTRRHTQTFHFGLPNRGPNYITVVLEDRALY